MKELTRKTSGNHYFNVSRSKRNNYLDAKENNFFPLKNKDF